MVQEHCLGESTELKNYSDGHMPVDIQTSTLDSELSDDCGTYERIREMGAGKESLKRTVLKLWKQDSTSTSLSTN